ncbi:MAG TPA: methanogenesis marker 16 metalloprotein [Methanothermobacter sp.]|uniref:Methanogenesis marker 16 metalloprotein n=1 Tax=Methanothermobacter tenebrarum TaxID=680118 RepID=A0ABM7YF74_9EURY|nr:methanogenesis marker 16 metalloprotein [Methanothermobacter tenebrarum]MDD3454057.1 methanogenesis marker 16 metalloprotein [Methanobacteriales archaeon]MDI6882121.1 methanogenesis marker 16 metalloprotein [Methanothermobacter sp.]MDX9692811.1 methanogenesis marker 16 metalloprotein [Methanothermobacter sp.]BDH80045.1 methanogenesis marker 16 metalloprotein [Methanothermobacter tenebrarum]HHW16401.1 methanogenesis marker 16 metalloprotein [Methanothermobacter sp.]
MGKTIKGIKEKIEKGEAQIFTVQQIKEMLRNQERISIDDVDIVTTATCGIMSGTAAIMHFKVAEPGKFKKAKKVYLNGVPATPGPCPNENLGLVDIILYGTSTSIENPDYGGGFLLNDILKRKEIEVIIESTDSKTIKTSLTLDKIKTARIIGTRMAYKNYMAFINPSDEPIPSIFNPIPMEGPYKGLSFSGCGELNPLQNDPTMETIKIGSPILLNGAPGMIIGEGTRSTPEKPNLMIAADLHHMNPYYIGGFRTAAGPEIFNTIAIPIPILNKKILANTLITNDNIPLPIADIRDRRIINKTNYKIAWMGDERPSYHPQRCANCEKCLVAERCPTLAFKNTLDLEKCFGCGMCANSCPNNVFEMRTGKVTLQTNNKSIKVPVVCRQSDIKRAKKLAEELKYRIESGEFPIR